MRQVEKEKNKILAPYSVYTRHGQENSDKNSKKIQKIKKPLLGIIFSQNRMRQAKKQKKKIETLIPFILDPGKKISKKIVKKIKKPLPNNILSQNGMRQAEKQKNQILVPHSVHTRPGQQNFNKNSKKIQKIKKTSSRHYFQPKQDEIGQKIEKKRISDPNSVHTRPGQENIKKKQ